MKHDIVETNTGITKRLGISTKLKSDRSISNNIPYSILLQATEFGNYNQIRHSELRRSSGALNSRIRLVIYLFWISVLGKRNFQLKAIRRRTLLSFSLHIFHGLDDSFLDCPYSQRTFLPQIDPERCTAFLILRSGFARSFECV